MYQGRQRAKVVCLF